MEPTSKGEALRKLGGIQARNIRGVKSSFYFTMANQEETKSDSMEWLIKRLSEQQKELNWLAFKESVARFFCRGGSNE